MDSIKWRRDDGVYRSEDDRFSIIKATDRIHNGDWELYDRTTKEERYGYSLKHAKQIAEDVLSRNPDGHPPEKQGWEVSEELWRMNKSH